MVCEDSSMVVSQVWNRDVGVALLVLRHLVNCTVQLHELELLVLDLGHFVARLLVVLVGHLRNCRLLDSH